ncbi:MAG: hypothetical protein JWN34_5053, partial [Bryobacterales bacterium]|nr:hypothetical protein [Bryobacterales bacterium]
LNLPLLILRNGKNRRHSGHVSVYADLRFTSSYLLDTTLATAQLTPLAGVVVHGCALWPAGTGCCAGLGPE